MTLFDNWLIWAALAAVFAALTAILAKLGVAEVNSNFATFLRTIVVVVAMGLLVWATGEIRGASEITGRGAIFLVLSGLATGASWLCYFRALKLGPASQVAPIDKLSVVLVVIFAAIFLGERLSTMGWLGAGLMALGAVLVALG